MKLILTINDGGLAGKSFNLETGFMTIGRSSACSVRFDPVNERVASKQHCFIEAKPDGYYVTDNQSTNGTLVNGIRVSSQRLHSGDSIQFGKNGTTASVIVMEDTALQANINPATVEQFRTEQINEFNSVITNKSVNLQQSLSGIGLGNIEANIAQPTSNTGKYIGIGVTIFGLVFLSLIVVAIMFLSVGVVPAVIATVVAFTPAILYLFPLIWLDRYDPEPLWLLALAFAWGALVAVVVSFIFNTFAGTVVAIAVSPEAGQVFGAVISAPIVEESSKGIGLLILLIFFRRYFDDILDGIVFGGVIALGFATVENVLYYGRALSGGGFGMLMVLFVLRGILSPFAHVTFTAMTGIGCGIARESHNSFVKIIMPVLGYIGAVALHALWNGMAVFLGPPENFLVGYAVIQVPFFVIFVIFSFVIMYRQNRILKEMLAIDVATGVVPEADAKTATSAFKSTAWLLGGLFNGKILKRSRYLRAIGKLGLSHWHIKRATAAQGETASFQQNPLLRDEVLKWRDQV